MAFNEKKAAPVKTGAVPVEKKERPSKNIRIDNPIYDRLVAVAEMKGMTAKQLAQLLISAYCDEEIKKAVEAHRKYKD